MYKGTVLDVLDMSDVWHTINYKDQECYIPAVYESPPIDWSRIFFKLAKEMGLKKNDVWNLTLPQLERYMVLLNEDIEFSFKHNANSTAYGIGLAFGGSESKEVEEFEDVSEDNISQLEQIFSGF